MVRGVLKWMSESLDNKGMNKEGKVWGSKDASKEDEDAG